MPLYTSPQFASAAASGKDWRDTSRAVLEKLQTARTAKSGFNFGFLYISDLLVDDASSILNIFKSVLQIENWIGTVGVGICGAGESFIDKPAIAAMIGYFEPEQFCVFPGAGVEIDQSRDKIAAWLEKNDPMMIFVHGDPMADEDPGRTLKNFEQITGGFLTGGLSSSRGEHRQFAGDVFQGGISGALFSQKIAVASTLSQGCKPIGPPHIITGCSDHIIRELDSEKAVTVFENDLRQMVLEKTGQDPDTVIVHEDALYEKEALQDELPAEFKSVIKGEMHVAFPVPGADLNDYLVRNVIGLDPDEGTITVSQIVANGESVMFVHRDEHTVLEDLSKSLVELRERVKKQTGTFAPQGAVYVSCMARAFSEPGHDYAADEMKLVREIIGDVPLAGFYAGGEISKGRLYGYTGILTLFL